MLEKVLLAIDGSVHSDKAVPVAIDIAKKSGGEVVVLHVREHSVTKGGTWERESDEDGQALVEKAGKTIEEAGVKATTELRRALSGRVAPTIVDAAAEADADLVVMGSRGLSDVRGLLIGSVTHKVIQLSDRPVLVAR